jgi:hypothetical protein
MLKLLNFSFDGDIHWFFLLQTSKSSIHRFCLPMPLRFRKHKGHDLAYDVKIMTSQQMLSRNVTSTFCRTMFVDIADTTVPNLIYV